MEDDGPVLGSDPDPDQPARLPVPASWLVAIGLVVTVAVVYFSSRSSQETAATSAAAATTTAPPGEVVDRTLDWQQVSGLEEATGLRGLVEFDDSYWLAGETSRGISVWSSDDGDRWDRVATIEETEDWRVEDLEAGTPGMVLAAVGSPTDGGLFHSTDGAEWSSVNLPSGDPERPVVFPYDVTMLDDEIVVQGAAATSFPDSVLEALPETVVELVRSGTARINLVVRGDAAVTITPGIEIARISEDDLPDGFQPHDTRGVEWRGRGPSDLQPSELGFPQRVEKTRDDLLIGEINSELVTSPDGQTWEDGVSLDGILGFSGWRGGAVVVHAEGAPSYWVPGEAEAAPLVPGEILTDSAWIPASAAGEGWGLALMLVEPSLSPSVSDPIVVVEEGSEELRLTPDLQVEMIREGELVWQEAAEAAASLLDDGSLRFGEGADSMVVGLDEWLEANAKRFVPTADVSIVHTSDGERWSVTDADDITGTGQIVDMRLLGTEDLVMVVSQTPEQTSSVAGVGVGRPLD